jgi:Homeodomain-like domain
MTRRSPSAAFRRKRHLQVLKLLAQELTVAQVAERTGYSPTQVRNIRERARPGGPKHVPEDP